MSRTFATAPEDYSVTPRSGLIGLVETAGALGLVLPAATDIAPVLTPPGAAGLMPVMLGAAGTHLRRREMQFLPRRITDGR